MGGCLEITFLQKAIAQFGYIKIQLETKDITTRLRGINHINLLYYSPKPPSDVFCFKLNFNISKLGYLLNTLAQNKEANLISIVHD